MSAPFFMLRAEEGEVPGAKHAIGLPVRRNEKGAPWGAFPFDVGRPAWSRAVWTYAYAGRVWPATSFR
ncbi:hypothetical protein BX604_0444 [Burkholderia sp. JKS000303]|nr:hypothetical protein BX604_0444 [Burkholderia sp. JKS000303]